jgi:ribosome-associated toxin RatA of RatAB toxin-antitoxin module
LKKKLSLVLKTNFVFSSLTGIILAFFSLDTNQLFNTNSPETYSILGWSLIGFSFFLLYQSIVKNPLAVFIIFIMDYLWVIGSFLILSFKMFNISFYGYLSIGFVAIVVLVFGTLEQFYLSKFDNIGEDKKRLKFEKPVYAPKEIIWNVISDVENYHEVADNIDDVKILSGNGQNMVRQCSHGKDSWTEECTLWKDEEVYEFLVNTKAKDYPYPFDFLKGRWEIVKNKDENNYSIKMNFDFSYKKKYHNWLIHPMLKLKFTKIAEDLLDKWEKKILNRKRA